MKLLSVYLGKSLARAWQETSQPGASDGKEKLLLGKSSEGSRDCYKLLVLCVRAQSSARAGELTVGKLLTLLLSLSSQRQCGLLGWGWRVYI